jgi:hypothetical protein
MTGIEIMPLRSWLVNFLKETSSFIPFPFPFSTRVPRSFSLLIETEAKIFSIKSKKSVFLFGFFACQRNSRNLKRNQSETVEK